MVTGANYCLWLAVFLYPKFPLEIVILKWYNYLLLTYLCIYRPVGEQEKMKKEAKLRAKRKKAR